MSLTAAPMDPDLTDSGEVPRQYRSVRFADVTDSEVLITKSQRSHHSTGSGSLHGGKSLRSNLMRQQKSRDPLFVYEVINVVGVGSMGSVATVKKRDEVVGGSARSEVVESFKKQKKDRKCFSIPVLGPFFMFCLKGTYNQTAINESYHSIISESKKNLFESTDSTQSPNGDSVSTHGTRGNVVYAIKSIHLNRVKDKSFIKELKNEIEILKKLDHPHIVRPIETFHHRDQIFIVMELCSGGDLYSRDPYTEEEAARITSSILSAVSYMHSKEIMHRDLKYENVLFVNDSPYAEIKLIDFGLSKKYIGGQKLTDITGTIYTMAPEVLKGSYTQKADIWSIAIIAYMLLSSQMPFYGRKQRQVVKQIMKCQYNFRGRRWKRVSEQAKAFVEDMLVVDPEDRPTAEEAFSNMWLNKHYGATVRAPTMDEVGSSTTSLKAFAGYSKLKKLALMVIAHKSTSEEIGVLRKIFQQYDVRKDGCLSFEEFKAAMEQYRYSEEEVEDMFDAVDLDGTGMIRYTEFLAATIETHGAISEERLAEAFDRLDSDDSGYISAENLAEILGDEFPKEEIDEIIMEDDLNKDHRISYSEFLALWESHSEDIRDHLYKDIQPSLISMGTSLFSGDTDSEDLQNLAESNILARANFIKGKHVSEHKHKEVIVTGDEKGKKISFAAVEEIPEFKTFNSCAASATHNFSSVAQVHFLIK